MEDELHKQVVSQHEAISAIAKAVRKSRAGLKDPKRPIGSFSGRPGLWAAEDIRARRGGRPRSWQRRYTQGGGLPLHPRRAASVGGASGGAGFPCPAKTTGE
jgi:hypothetical protein